MTFPMPITGPWDLDLDDIRTRFLDHLSMDDRNAFLNHTVHTPEDLNIYTTQLMNTFQGKKRTGKLMLRKIAELTMALGPYFKVLGLVVQSVTAYAATVWGSLLLLLKMASPFPSLLHRLSELLQEVSTHIPPYQKLLKFLEANEFLRGQLIQSDKLRQSLHGLYRDLLQLFGNMGRVFTQRNQRLLDVPLAAYFLPFDSQFDDTLEKLSHYAQELDSVILPLSQNDIRTALSSREGARIRGRPLLEQKSGGISRGDLIARIRAWLHAPSYDDCFKRARSLCHRGTADWLFEQPAYKSWLTFSQDTSPLLWVKGVPGTGKTVLAAAAMVVNLRLPARSKDSGPRFLSSYFFDPGSPVRNCVRTAYASLLAQVLDGCSKTLNPDILNLFSYAITRRAPEKDFATLEDMADIIKLLKPLLTHWYIVLDAVDECDRAEEFLSCLLDPESTHRPRILLFARPTVSYFRRNKFIADTITVKPELVDPDLRTFFRYHLEEMRSSGLLGRGADLQGLVRQLLLGANGVFQWAQLMITYLKAEVPRAWTQVQDLKRRDNLTAMYIRILTALAEKPYVERLFARRMFIWIVCAKGVARLDYLEDLLQTLWREGHLNLTPEDDKVCLSMFENFERSIVRTCLGLVEVRWADAHQAKVCRFTSSSVHECLKKHRTRGADFFYPSSFEAESELLRSCLYYRGVREHHQLLSGDTPEAASGTTFDDTRRFLRYATVSWTKHLSHPADDARETLDAVLQMLQSFLAGRDNRVAWVEALYRYRACWKEIKDDLRNWAAAVLTSSFGQYSEVKEKVQLVHVLAEDLDPIRHRRNIETFRNGLPLAQQKPLATATVPQRKHSSKPERLSSWCPTPRCQIFCQNSSGGTFANLEILQLVGNATRDGCSSIAGASNAPHLGWVARYQILATVTGEPVLEGWDFPVNEPEITSHMAFHPTASGPSRESVDAPSPETFNMSISQNLDLFTVLDTVYVRTNHCGWVYKRLPITCDARSFSVLQPVGSRGHTTPYHSVFKTGRAARSRIFVHNDLVIYQGVAKSNYDWRSDLCRRDFENESCLMVIFKIESAVRDVNIKAIAILDGLDFANVFESCVFHPRLPLVALILHTGSFYQRAALWSFASPSSIKHLDVNYVTPLDFQKDNGATDTKVLADCGPAARVWFSECGTQLLLELRLGSCQEQFDLWESPVYHAAVREHEKSQGSRAEQRSGISRRAWELHQAQSRLSWPLETRPPPQMVQPDGRRGLNTGLFHQEENSDGKQMTLWQPEAAESDPHRSVVQLPTATRPDGISPSADQAQQSKDSSQTSMEPPPQPLPITNTGALVPDTRTNMVDQGHLAPAPGYTVEDPTLDAELEAMTNSVAAAAPSKRARTIYQGDHWTTPNYTMEEPTTASEPIRTRSYQYEQTEMPQAISESRIVSGLTANTQDVQATVPARKRSADNAFYQIPTPPYTLGRSALVAAPAASTPTVRATEPVRKASVFDQFDPGSTPDHAGEEHVTVSKPLPSMDDVRAAASARKTSMVHPYGPAPTPNYSRERPAMTLMQDVRATAPTTRTSMAYPYDPTLVPFYSEEPSVTTTMHSVPATKTSTDHHFYQASTPRYSMGEATREPSECEQAPTPYYVWAECALMNEVRAIAPARLQRNFENYQQEKALHGGTPASQGDESPAVPDFAASPLQDWTFQQDQQMCAAAGDGLGVSAPTPLPSASGKDESGRGHGRGRGRSRVRSRGRGLGR